MHYIIPVVATLALSVAAAPYKRDEGAVKWVTQTDVEYATAVVTVTADDEHVSTSASVVASTTCTSEQHSSAAPSASKSPESHSSRRHHHHVSSDSTIAVVSSTSTSSILLSSSSSATPTTTSSSTASSSAVPETKHEAPVAAITSAQAVSATSVPPSAAPSTAAAGAKPTSYQELVVAHHNLHRQNHSAPDVVWDAPLADAAAQVAASCKYDHNTDLNYKIIGGYGQNIAAGQPESDIGAAISDGWYNNEVINFGSFYGQKDPVAKKGEPWGHFSAIVWKATTKVGCATQHCPKGLENIDPTSGIQPYFTVCNYQETGNVAGMFGDQIVQSLNHATAHGDYFK